MLAERRAFFISRRRFVQGSLALAGLGLLAGCGISRPFGQQLAKIPVIGFLAVGSREGVCHKSSADSLALELRHHSQGRQRQHVHEPG